MMLFCFRYTVHTNQAYSPDEDEIAEVHTPNRKKKKFTSKHNSDGWEEMLIDERPYIKSKESNLEKPKHSNRDRDSLSNYSDRNSVLTGRSDIPLVQVHPPPSDNTRTKSGEGHKWNNDRDNDRYIDRRNQRNMGSDRRNKRYSGSDKGNARYTESDVGYNSDKLSVSSSYLSPTIQRSQRAHNKQKGHVPRSRSPNRLDDVVFATQKQNLAGRSRPRHYRHNYAQRRPLQGTTPDKTVFPEKITLKLRGFRSPKTGYKGPKKSRKNGIVVMETSLDNIHWKQYGQKLSYGLRSYDDDVFDDDDDDNDDDAYSSNSSWIGIPWHSYKLPPGFQDPNADEELSV